MKISALRRLGCITFGPALILTSVFAGCSSPQEKKETAENTGNAANAGNAGNAGNAANSETPDKGERFLAENKTREGVKTTASGLQYKVLTEGSGRKPSVTDTVVCNYRGTLIGGTEFDSSYKRGEPAEFSLNHVIPGWTEGLQLMRPGSKYQFFVPSKLAYGTMGTGDLIGPNETLIFEIELIRIK